MHYNNVYPSASVYTGALGFGLLALRCCRVADEQRAAPMPSIVLGHSVGHSALGLGMQAPKLH